MLLREVVDAFEDTSPMDNYQETVYRCYVFCHPRALQAF
jgi:hypothetical protein